MIKQVMQAVDHKDIFTLDDVLAADNMAREAAYEWLDTKNTDSRK
jgi:1-deoxy-D-xylulose-5-phosphate reductoisomerase